MTAEGDGTARLVDMCTANLKLMSLAGSWFINIRE
jgi:hypothetical protein